MKHKTLRTLLCVILTVCFCLSAIVPASAAGLFGGDIGAASIFDEWFRSPKDLKDRIIEKNPGTDETPADPMAGTETNGFYRIVHLDCGRKYFSKDWIIALLYEMKADGYNQLQLAFGNDGLRFLLNDMSFTANGTTYSHKNVVSKVEAGNKAQNSSGDGRWLTETEMNDIVAKAKELGIEIVPLLNLPGHANAILDIADDAYNASGSNNTLNVAGGADTAAANFGYALFTKYVDYFAGKDCKFFNFGADEYANDASGTFSFSRLNSTEYQNFTRFIAKLTSYIVKKGMTARSFNDGLYYNGQSVASDVADTIKRIQCCYWSSGWGSYPVASASTISNNGHSMINTHGDYYYVLGLNEKNANKDQFHTNGYTYASGFSNTSFAGGTPISSPIGSMFCIWCDDPTFESEKEIAANTRLILRAMGQRMQGNSITGMDTTTVVANGFNADGTINTGSVTPDPEPEPEPTDVVTINLTYGGQSEEREFTSDISSIINKTSLNEKIATVEYNYEKQAEKITNIESGKSYYISDGTVSADGKYSHCLSLSNGAFADADSNTAVQWKFEAITSYGTTYYKISNGSVYLCYNNGLKTGDENSATNWSISENGNLYYSYYYGYKEYYLRYNNGWIATNGTGSNKFAQPYTITNDSTLTFNPVLPGETYIMVGTTKYIIKVAYRQENVSVVNGQQKQITVSGTLDDSGLDTSVATVAISGTTMTITAVANGTTSVKVGGVQYNITVADEDLSAVTPLTVEYWITNSRFKDSNENYLEAEINATDNGIATEQGVEIASLVPGTNSKDGRTQVYWQSKILDVTKDNTSTSGTELQTTKAGDDETLNGFAFTKVRYWNGEWQVFTTEWIAVDRTETTVTYTGDDSTTKTYTGEKNQLVAYYMELIDIDNDNGNSELEVKAADWGTKGDGIGSWGYTPESNRCSVSVQIVYEDSTTNPADVTAAALKSKTIVYGYWDGGRGLGTMIFTGQGYDIYKVTAETGTMTSTASSSNTVTVTNFTWADNEETVWGDDGSLENSVSIGNPARSPSYKSPYDNLAWNTGAYNNNNAILIRVYVKTPVTPDSLKVNYFDENDLAAPFYDYNISVVKGTTFDSRFAKSGSGGLIYNTVENINGVTQTVQSDLTKMTEIGAQYRYGNFILTRCELSEDRKTVNLYYTFNRKAEFVVDYGMPLTITPGQVNKYLTREGTSLDSVSISGLTYGRTEVNSDKSFTYIPTKPINGVEHITVTYYGHIFVEQNNGDLIQQDSFVSYEVYIIPASNVYYEETVLTSGKDNAKGSTSWTAGGTATSTNQALEVAGTNTNVHGFDSIYNAQTTFSMGGYMTATMSKPTTAYGALTNDYLSFKFNGTGYDVVSECGPNTGMLWVERWLDGSCKKVTIVDTSFYGDNTFVTGDGILAYQIPVVRELDLTKGEYEIRIYGYSLASSGAYTGGQATANVAEASLYSLEPVADTFAMDEDSIYNILTAHGIDADMVDIEFTSMQNNNEVAVYAATAQAAKLNTAAEVQSTNATSTVVYVDAFRVYQPISDESKYDAVEQGEKYASVYDYVKNGAELDKDLTDSAVYVEYSGNQEITRITELDDYKHGGPQNEVYLTSSTSMKNYVGMILYGWNGSSHLMVSAKAISGKPTLATETGEQHCALAIQSSTEMYYDITKYVEYDNELGQYILILGNGSSATSVLSVAAFKVSSDVTVKASSTLAQRMTAYITTNSVETTFAPKVFRPTEQTNAFVNDVITIPVQATVDVCEFVVYSDSSLENAVPYISEPYWNNKRAFNKGKTDVKSYLAYIQAPEKPGEYTYYMAAFDADGNRSAPVKVVVTVTE